jgi:hypothetical protein
MPDEIAERRPAVWPSLLIAFLPTAAAWGFALFARGAEYVVFAALFTPATVIIGLIVGPVWYGLRMVRYNARNAEAIANASSATATAASDQAVD